MSEETITTELQKYKDSGANLLMPSTHIAGLSEFHAPVIETVTLSTDPNDGDVYEHDRAEEGPAKKWRPTKQALMKLSVCAGVIWSTSETRRIDNGANRDYIAYRAVGGVRKADGQPVFFSAEYDMDFEVLEEEIRESYTKKVPAWKNMKAASAATIEKTVDELTKRDLLQKRKHRLKLCEAGAMNRVLRMLLGIKQAYTAAELSKPFVMARIVFRPDFTDKDVRQQFITASIKQMVGIYGPGALDSEIRESKPIDITPCPEEVQEPENGGNGAGEEGDPIESQVTDFKNMPKIDQIILLTKLSFERGYDLAGYQKKAKLNLGDFTPAKLEGLFQHLMSLPDPLAADNDVPFGLGVQ